MQKGDQLVGAGGVSLDVADPRVLLGEAIGAAEGRDGKLVFDAKRGEGVGKVTLAVPVLGPYAPTWPAACKKSAAIISDNAEYIAAAQAEDGSYQFGGGRAVRDGLDGCLAGLFLLSTGDDAYLPKVKRHAHALALAVAERPTKSNWHLGYQGILLAEYYLRTGDRAVLAGLKSLCDQAVGAQAAGGWGHGGVPGPGYVQSGLMSSAGVPVLTALILARECGVEVDDAAYARAVKFMYRMAGHGCVPYGDHRSELWWSNTNGRNAKLACALSLLDGPRFQKAAGHLATMVADSYYQPEFGHTGGGFNVIWRGMASVHVPEARRSHYRRQLDELAWYYDLSRQPGGGFSILPTPPDNSRYSGLSWGSGSIGLTYTAPLATLRITGAPRTKYSVKGKPVDFEWGTAADEAFLSSSDAGGFGEEAAAPHEVYLLLLKDRKEEATVPFCAKHLRHYSPLVRTWAARRLKEINSPEAHAALAEAAAHADPRVRPRGLRRRVRLRQLGAPVQVRRAARVRLREDPAGDSQGAQRPGGRVVGEGRRAIRAGPRAARGHPRRVAADREVFGARRVVPFRESAFWAIVGLGDSISGPEFETLGEIYGDSRHVYARNSYDAGFRTVLRADPAALDRASKSKVVKVLGRTTHDVPVALGYGTGGVHEATHRTMMILKHFDPEVYQLMVDDFVTYLGIWEPYYQHSVWLITGSKWQPGILKVLEGLGAEGGPVVAALKEVKAKFASFDKKTHRQGGRRPGEADRRGDLEVGEGVRVASSPPNFSLNRRKRSKQRSFFLRSLSSLLFKILEDGRESSISSAQ